MPLSDRLQPHHRVFAAFAIYAFGLGQLFPRLPEIKAAMGIAEGTLGLALVGTSLGTIIALTLSAPLVERVGYRKSLLILIPVMSACLACAVFATGPLALFVLLIPAGLAVGAIEAIINIEADRTEATMDRRIMNRAHAFWSIGFFAAGMFSAALASLGTSPQWQLILALPIVCFATWVCLSDFTPAPKRGTDSRDAAPLVARPTFAIVVLFGFTLSAMLLEGASIDWSAIYMTSVFEVAPYMGGLAVATGAIAQGLVRYFADGFVDKYAPVAVARMMLTTMAIGVLLVFFASSPAIALLGFACIGAGTSVMFPLAMSAAAQRSDRSAAFNVAALAQMSFVAFLLGPPLLGFIAEHLGLRWTFGFGLPLIALSFALAGTLGSKPAPQKS